jgi:hypothetical protein
VFPRRAARSTASRRQRRSSPTRRGDRVAHPFDRAMRVEARRPSMDCAKRGSRQYGLLLATRQITNARPEDGWPEERRFTQSASNAQCLRVFVAMQLVRLNPSHVRRKLESPLLGCGRIATHAVLSPRHGTDDEADYPRR